MRLDALDNFDEDAYWNKLLNPRQTPFERLLVKLKEKEDEVIQLAIVLRTLILPLSFPFPPRIMPIRPDGIARSRLAESMWLARHKRDIILDAIEIRTFDAAVRASEMEWVAPNDIQASAPRERHRRRRPATRPLAECTICGEQEELGTGAPCGHVLCRDCKRGILRAAGEEGRRPVCHICRTPY